jgi:hypothetical protein
MKLSIKENSTNYVCTVVEIKDLFPIEGADKIQRCVVNGNDVVVSKDVKLGDKMLYFVSGTRLNEDYCRYNNLLDKAESNNDTTNFPGQNFVKLLNPQYADVTSNLPSDNRNTWDVWSNSGPSPSCVYCNTLQWEDSGPTNRPQYFRHQGIQTGFYYTDVKSFIWSHGGTSFCDIEFNTLLKNTPQSSGQIYTPDYGPSCYVNVDSTIPGFNVSTGVYPPIMGASNSFETYRNHDDGSFGYNYTNTTWYRGLFYMFGSCIDANGVCSECEDDPLLRSFIYYSASRNSTTGKWSRNFGLENTIALIKSAMAEYYLYSTSANVFPKITSLSGSTIALKTLYGATGLAEFNPLYTVLDGPTQRTTVAEG